MLSKHSEKMISKKTLINCKVIVNGIEIGSVETATVTIENEEDIFREVGSRHGVQVLGNIRIEGTIQSGEVDIQMLRDTTKSDKLEYFDLTGESDGKLFTVHGCKLMGIILPFGSKLNLNKSNFLAKEISFGCDL